MIYIYVLIKKFYVIWYKCSIIKLLLNIIIEIVLYIYIIKLFLC